MIIGPWGHGASQKFGDVDFGPSAMRSLCLTASCAGTTTI